MKRCPTTPVAPRTATLRLRIDEKCEASERRGDEPAPLGTNPAQQPEAGRAERREGFVVAQDSRPVQPDLPAPAFAGVVFDRLVEQLALPPDVGHANHDAREGPFDRRRVAAALGVVT